MNDDANKKKQEQDFNHARVVLTETIKILPTLGVSPAVLPAAVADVLTIVIAATTRPEKVDAFVDGLCAIIKKQARKRAEFLTEVGLNDTPAHTA